MRGQLEPEHAIKASAKGSTASIFQRYPDGSLVGTKIYDDAGLIYTFDTGTFLHAHAWRYRGQLC